MKKILKWMGIALLIPVLLFVSLTALLYFPPFQQWAAEQVAAYASEKTGMEISVGIVRLKFPLDLSVNDVRVTKCEVQGAKCDTIAAIRNVVADVQLLPLLKKQVVINELSLQDANINTSDIIDAVRVKGRVGTLRITHSDILLIGRDDPTVSDVILSDALLADAALDVVIPDSVPEDTTSTRTLWRIIAQNAKIRNSDISLTFPSDSISEDKYSVTSAHIGEALLRDGSFDLKNGDYKLVSITVSEGVVNYDDINVDKIELKADSLTYRMSPKAGEPQLTANVRSLSLKESSRGFDIKNIAGKLAIVDDRLKLKDASIETSESQIYADYEMALNAFDEVNPGTMKGTLSAKIGKHDLMRMMDVLPNAFRRKWPDKPLTIDGVVRGNMQNMSFSEVKVSLPTAFNLNVSGSVQNLSELLSDDSSASLKKFQADVDFDARGSQLDFLRELMPQDVRNEVRIPQGIAVSGNVKANGQKYNVAFKSSIPLGRSGIPGLLAGNVMFDAEKMNYSAKLNVSNLPLQQIAPSYGLFPVSGNLQLRNDHVYADLFSNNDRLDGHAKVDAMLSSNSLRGTVTLDLAKADLQKLGIVDSELVVSGCAHLDINSDMKDSHSLRGSFGDLTVRMQNEVFRPDDIWVDALATPDKTHAIVDAGDFHLALDARVSYDHLLDAGNAILHEVEEQYGNRVIDQKRLRSLLPPADITINSGSDNFIMKMLNRYGYSLRTMSGNLASSPKNGLNGNLHIESLLVDSILVDTVNFSIRSDSLRTSYQAQIRNNKKNPQYTFNALVDGIIQDRGTTFGVRLFDENDELGVRLGMQATMESDGFMFRPYGKEPVLGYRRFKVNDGNFIYLGPDNRVSANITLRADDGTGIQLYSNDENEDAKQDITVSLHNFDLEKILAVVPYTPDISGILEGDFHLVQSDNQVSVSSDVNIRQMAYEKSPMGDMGAEFVYMPKDDGSHYVDGILLRNNQEIATVSGTYYNNKEKGGRLNEEGGYLDAQVDLARLPLSLANVFFPDQLMGLEGYGEGTLSVRGPLSKPVVDGEVYLDSAYMVSAPYGIRLRFDNDPVTIKDSKLLFENFNVYANNDNPLTTYGALNFSDLDHMRLDLKMQAKNFLLIDAKENPRSEAYGKAYVNFFGNINGELSKLKMRGKLDVLGATDLVYILRDSPISTDTQLDELVKFTDFSDTAKAVVDRPDLIGFQMDLTVDVSNGTHVMAYMNADKTNYIDLMGGGTLRMLYDTADNLRLTGRYTLANGEMKYSLPIIPLRTFTIRDGSYLEFTGDPMNPTINITATEQTKAAVTGSNGVGRSVEFECGVIITKTLNDMGLEFTLDAPEDLQLHSELQSMSKEQRGKLAVTMLTTGMYLADGNTNGFSMNNALNTFLQSEINTITGNALRTLDFTVGLDNTTDATGNTSTNYSFKFAKRFWNNRLRIAVGGKVSTGADIPNQNQSFFDNVLFEYRLDDTANKYVTLFYENNVYDWLDGYTQEYGVGFIWRRSLQSLKDIFNLHDQTQRLMTTPPARSDTLRRDSLIISKEGRE